MAQPTIADQFFAAPKAAAPPGGGGSIADQFFGSPTRAGAAPPAGGKSFTAPAPPPTHGGGGGVLGAISRIPGDFVGHVVPDVEGAVIGTGRLVKNAVAPGTHPSWGQLAHEYAHPLDWFSSKNIHADPLARQVVETGKGTLQVAEHPLRDPFATALLGYGAGAGLTRVGLATKAGLGGETAELAAAKPYGKLTARAAEGGAPITVRTLPRDPFIAARMKAVDKALKAVTRPTTPVVGEFSRAARAVEREGRKVTLKAAADPRLAAWHRAFGKLGPVERVALGTLARVPLPADAAGWKAVLRSRNTEVADKLLEVLSDPKVMERYSEFQRFPKIVAAHEAAKNLVTANEEIGLRAGALQPETIASAPAIGTRVARGAEFVTHPAARAAATVARRLGNAAARESLKVTRAAAREAERAARALHDQADVAERRAFALQTRLSATERGHLEAARVADRAAEKASAVRFKHGPRAAKAARIEKLLRRQITLHDAAYERFQRGELSAGRLGRSQRRLERLQAEYDLNIESLRAVRQAEAASAAARPLQETHGEAMRAHGQRAAEEAAREVERAALLRQQADAEMYHALQVKEYGLEHIQTLRAAAEDRAQAHLAEGGNLIGGGTPEEIAAQIEAAGRPQPVKLPDVQMQERARGGSAATGAPMTPPESPVRQSTGALMRTGAIDLTTDTLTPHYLATARYESRQTMDGIIDRAAQPVPKGEGLPVGMVWKRTTRGQKIPHLETTKLEHLTELTRVFPDEEHPFTVSDVEARQALLEGRDLIATDAAGNRLAVSKQFADALSHQYRNEGVAMRYLFTKPLDVWRALVLNLRVPWLINNIVGNNLLYALRFAGNGGLRAYVDMLRDVRPGFAKRLLNSEATRTLSPADIAEVFPEQTRGTFIGTQLPTGKLGKFTKPVRALNAGLAPLDRRTEQFLRRGGVNTVLRNSPEAKAIYKAMPRQTRNWREAMLQAARENGDLRDLTVREVNDALGDYLSLGPFERGVLRRAAPFYGWYREITRIAAHTIVDRPLRALILTRLGQLESDKQEELRGAFPTFLQGSLALGAGPNGTENLLALRSANPLSTTVDLGRAAAFFANPTNRSNAEALLGLTNPYAEAAAATAFGSARADVASPAYLGPAATALNKFGLPGSVLAQVAGGLPEVQAAFPPPPSRLYPTRSQADIILRLLGDIRRQPSLAQAHYYAAQGR